MNSINKTFFSSLLHSEIILSRKVLQSWNGYISYTFCFRIPQINSIGLNQVISGDNLYKLFYFSLAIQQWQQTYGS